MMQHNRFKGAPWYNKTAIPILVGGAGGIGSWTALFLSRAGFKIVVADFDLLEEHNLGGQIYPKTSIGDSKVQALTKIIKDFCDVDITSIEEAITASSPTSLYCISAFDNMAARKIMFDKWLNKYKNDPNAIFIDGRLEAEYMKIFCIRGTDYSRIEEYIREELVDDSKIEDAPCTMKQTSHCAAMIASHVVAFFTNHIVNIAEAPSREVPYSWEYFIPMNLLQEIRGIEYKILEDVSSENDKISIEL